MGPTWQNVNFFVILVFFSRSAFVSCSGAQHNNHNIVVSPSSPDLHTVPSTAHLPSFPTTPNPAFSGPVGYYPTTHGHAEGYVFEKFFKLLNIPNVDDFKIVLER